MDGNIVLFGSRGERERVILPYRDFGTAQEDILTRPGLGLLFVYLNFNNVAGMLDNLRDEGLVATSDLTQTRVPADRRNRRTASIRRRRLFRRRRVCCLP